MSEPTVIGVYGGSFNPPHVVHQWVALYALETVVDELLVVPAYKHVFGKSLVSFEHRMAMCETAFAGLPRVQISRIEQELANAPGFVASRMLDTLTALARRRPDATWRLLIGADILAEAHAWHRWEDVVALAPPLVIGRAGFEAQAEDPAVAPLMPAVSSTAIRRALAAGEDVSAWLPRSVQAYVRAQALYVDA